MKNITKLSVGIPAYNEGANIKQLLNSVLNQIEDNYKLHEVIVISDGSTDNTVSDVKKINNNKIWLIENSNRKGKSERINNILELFKGDLLFLIDADIKIRDRDIFSKTINNIDFNEAGLVGINAVPDTAYSFFQKIINTGVSASNQISSSWNQGKNYLSFKGCFLGLSRQLAKKTHLDPELVNNDAYLYFNSKYLGYQPVFYKDAKVYYKSPKSLRDHINQSKRFINSKKEMQKYFNQDLDQEYNIPFVLYIGVVLKNITNNPILFINYLLIKLITSLSHKREIKSTWNVAVSTK